MSQKRFQDQVCLVTGAGSGIGRATALQLAAEGAVVLCSDIDVNKAQATAAASGPPAKARAHDVTREDQWSDLVTSLIEIHGRIDHLIHCAGITGASGIAQMEFAEWRRILSVNLDGAFLGIKHVVCGMSQGGSITLVSSASGIKAATGASAYSVSKAGLCMLSRTAAKEFRSTQFPVRVNTVCPGGVKTPMWHGIRGFLDMIDQHGSEEAAFDALAEGGGTRFAEASEVVPAILFLASEEAKYITGIDLVADDGYIL